MPYSHPLESSTSFSAFGLESSHSRTVPSSPPEAMAWPRGLKARVLIADVCPFRGSQIWRPAAASQTRMTLSKPAEAIKWESGLKHSDQTPLGCPYSVLFSLGSPEVRDQMTMVLSKLADARHLPSGLKLMALTPRECPSSGPPTCVTFPSWIAHKRTDLSLLAVARNRPSALNATALTQAEWPSSVVLSVAWLSPSTSQSLTVQSSLPDAIRLPLG
mmetsp:Transcript_19771/g.47053  ORF Transcript_19771/g.47053 Transcript_19771/m.47053 type:complete len:217 (-) Transcript_19771:511-1161(-)